MPPHNQQVRVLTRGESVTLTPSGSWAESTNQHVNAQRSTLRVQHSGICPVHGMPFVSADLTRTALGFRRLGPIVGRCLACG